MERIYFEKKIIIEILESWGFEDMESENIDWDGNNLRVSWDSGKTYDYISREDLSYSDKRLKQIQTDDIKLLEETI
jgi:hypothetical protein